MTRVGVAPVWHESSRTGQIRRQYARNTTIRPLSCLNDPAWADRIFWRRHVASQLLVRDRMGPTNSVCLDWRQLPSSTLGMSAPPLLGENAES